MHEHQDPEVRAAIIRLADALCMWERATGRRSVLIVREQGGFEFRAQDGKPGIPDDIPDDTLMSMLEQ